MKPQTAIREILYRWSRSLPVDEQSGESIVTVEEIERLNHELISSLNESSGFHRIRTWFTSIRTIISSKVLTHSHRSA